jgi:tRNA dimethylallyltransferase
MNPQINNLPILVLIGPTAIGKTSLSLQLAHRFNCEIISVDSMQVYKYMDIGTAKISKEEREGVVHHLLDVVPPDKPYDAASFVRDAETAIAQIQAKGKIPLLTGGTGLYLKALISGIFQAPPSNSAIRNRLKKRLETEGSNVLHKELMLCDCISANIIHPNNKQRLLRALEIYYTSGKPWSSYLKQSNNDKLSPRYPNMLKIGLISDRPTLYKRINQRTAIMITEGLEEEVRGLLDSGYSRDLKSMNSIGYRHMVKYILDEWSHDQMMELLARDTRRYAKRQITWFNREKELQWVDTGDPDQAIKKTALWLGC